MEKTFVLRTSVIVSTMDPTLRFDSDNTIVVPMPILESLYHYNGKPEKKRMAAKFIEYINSIPMPLLMSKEGYKQKNGSHLRIIDNKLPLDQSISQIQGITETDKRVFQICQDLTKAHKIVVLISQSPIIRLKAKTILDITSEPFKDEIFPDLHDQYQGYQTVSVSQTKLNEFYSEGKISIRDVYEHSSVKWQENMFCVLKSEGGDGIGRYTNNTIKKLVYQKLPNGYKALNLEQKMFWECLLTPPEEAPLVVVKGAAGTGKTFCSLAMALEKLNKYSSDGIYDQILVASPTVTVSNEHIGYLPGDIDDKVGPYLGGIMDNLKAIFRGHSPDDDNATLIDKAHELFDRGFIQIQPIGFLRGRTIPNTVFIIDETQNINPSDIKDIVTRAAKGSKFIFLGDPEQINNPELNSRYNGLVYLSEKMKGNSLCWQVTLNSEKSVRSSLAQAALKIL